MLNNRTKVIEAISTADSVMDQPVKKSKFFTIVIFLKKIAM